MARTTVVVSPRERYSPIIESLESLFSTISMDVPVIVVGAYPISVREKLCELSRARPFHHEVPEWPLIPHEARNIATELVETEYVAYCDNDIVYEPGWLDALEAHADRTGVEVVAPVICLGPPSASVIHHAGGAIWIAVDEKGMHLRDMHNLADKPIKDLEGSNLPQITDTGEFHAIFVRTEFVRQIGAFDERLITQEQNDFALRVKHAGGRIGFEPRAIVTYRAKTRLEPGDLAYHVFRWNHDDAVLSLDAFESTWGLYLDREEILYSWIRNHRRQRIMEAYAGVGRVLGSKFVEHVVAPVVEKRILRQVKRPAARRLPRAIPSVERDALLAELAKRPRAPDTLALPDQTWVDVAAFLRRQGRQGDVAAAPEEFRYLCDRIKFEFLPQDPVKILQPEAIVVLHKGRLAQQPQAALASLLSATPIFANEVFVLFSRTGTSIPAEAQVHIDPIKHATAWGAER